MWGTWCRLTWGGPCGLSSAPPARRSVIDILHLIDRLEELVGEGRKLPVGGGIVLSRQRLLDLVDRLRVAMPAEVREAQEIIDKRQEVLAQAEAEAASLIAKAQAEVEQRLQEKEVVKAAEERARQVLQEAEQRARGLLAEAEAQARARLDEAQESARQQMGEADVYALQTLQKLETELERFLTTVRKGMETLERRADARPPGREQERPP